MKEAEKYKETTKLSCEVYTVQTSIDLLIYLLWALTDHKDEMMNYKRNWKETFTV